MRRLSPCNLMWEMYESIRTYFNQRIKLGSVKIPDLWDECVSNCSSFIRRELAIVKPKNLKPWPPTKLQNLKGWLHPFGMKLFVSNHPKGLLIHLLLTPCLGMHQTSSPSTTVRRQRHWLRQKTLDEVSANLILFWPQCKRNVRQRKAQEQYYLRVWQKDPYKKWCVSFSKDLQRIQRIMAVTLVGWKKSSSTQIQIPPEIIE